MRKKLVFLVLLLFMDVIVADNPAYVIFNNNPEDSTGASTVIIDTLESIVGRENVAQLDENALEECLPKQSCFENIKNQYPTANIIRFDLLEQGEGFYLIISLWDQVAKKIISSHLLECEDCSVLSLINQLSDFNLNFLERPGDENHYLIAETSLNYQYNPTPTFNGDYYTININPEPSANVIINNIDFGMSPIEISNNKKERITVEIRRQNYEPYTANLTFGRSKKLAVKLKAIVANLKLKSIPNRAQVFVDGKEKSIGKTPITIKDITIASNIRIKLTLENYLDNEFFFTPKKKGNSSMTINLERGKGFLRIFHKGVDAKTVNLRINGVDYGSLDKNPLLENKSRPNLLFLDAGRNNIILQHNKVTRKKEIDIAIGETSDWEVEFLDSAPYTVTF